METRFFGTTEEDIQQAAEIIKEGGLVAFPTETVYGLGADALNPEAVGKVYAAKGRPSDNPMIVHISSKNDLSHLTFEITDDISEVDKLVYLLKQTEKKQHINLRNKEYFLKIMKNYKGYSYLVFGNIDLDKYKSFLEKENKNDNAKWN